MHVTDNCRIYLGRVLTLPMYPTLTIEEINYIAEEVETFFLKEKAEKYDRT